MKTSVLLFKIFIIFSVLFISCQNKPIEPMSKESRQNLIVLVKYKTQPQKSEEAVAGFTKLIEAVQKEPGFVKIDLMIDPKDDTNILLYEEWSDETYYNGDHMKTAHLRSFMEESGAFLAGPPEISQWKTEKEF